MADHYAKATELLDEVDCKRADLADEYDNARRPHVVAQLHQDIGRAMKAASIHAELATGQAVRHLCAILDQTPVALPIAYTIPAGTVGP